jgi:hypothetical protein
MQEDQTVSFQPMYVDRDQRWITKLLMLYLLIVLIVFLVRVVIIASNLRKLSRVQRQAVPDALSNSLWSDLYSKAHSFKDLSVITFLLSLLNFTWCTADDFLAIRAEKTPNIAYVLARTGEGLVTLGPGLVICIVLYSAAMLLQAVIRRRRAAFSAHDLTG